MLKEFNVFDNRHFNGPDACYYMPGGDDDDADDDRWLHYCAEASQVDRQHVLECVLSDLDAEDSPLFEFIDDAIANPHEPGRAKANLTDLARLGQSLLNLIA